MSPLFCSEAVCSPGIPSKHIALRLNDCSERISSFPAVQGHREFDGTADQPVLGDRLYRLELVQAAALIQWLSYADAEAPEVADFILADKLEPALALLQRHILPSKCVRNFLLYNFWDAHWR